LNWGVRHDGETGRALERALDGKDLWKEVRGLSYTETVREMRKVFGINLLDREKDFETLKRKVAKRIREMRELQREKREEFSKSEKRELRRAAYTVKSVGKVSSPKLLEYLKRRGIRKVPEWLKEVHYIYKPKNKHFYGLGAQNSTGAYNVRLASDSDKYPTKFVVCQTPEQGQSYSLIERAPRSETLVVVEGLFDALTLEQLPIESDFDILILNSITNTEKAVRERIFERYGKIVLALDNDKKGREAERKILDYLKGRDVFVKRLLYGNYKDLNEAFLNGASFKVEELRRPHPKMFIGTVPYATEGNRELYKAVISDSREVLEKLKARDIEGVVTDEDIKNYLEKHRCRGELEIYLPATFYKLYPFPEWVEKGVRESSWTERKRVSWSSTEVVEEEQRPSGIAKRRYWETKEGIITDRDIHDYPEDYLDIDEPEVRELAIRRLEEIKFERERQKEIQERIEWERERGWGRGPGL